MRRYIYRKKDGNPSKPVTFQVVSTVISMRLATGQGPYMIAVGDHGVGPDLNARQANRRTKELLKVMAPGQALRLYDQTGRAIFKATPVEIPVVTAPEGSPSIRVIYPAVFAEFDEKYGIVNLGICADKPGEHSKCNAWDIGVSKPKSADDIHAAILDIANWLRNRMLEDMQGEPTGLPVNGVIVMYQVCDRENTSWHAYSGTPHVSHTHVSGWPNLVPGWV